MGFPGVSGLMDATNNGFDLDLFPQHAEQAEQLYNERVPVIDMPAIAPSFDQLRQPTAFDQHVIVPRYMDELPELLQSQEFNHLLHNRYPNKPWSTLGEAVNQYLAVREFVHDAINAF